MKRISKFKDGYNKLKAIKNRKLSVNLQLWYRKYTYLNDNRAASEIKVESELKISAYLCKVGVETIVWKNIEITSKRLTSMRTNFSRKTINTYFYLKFYL